MPEAIPGAFVELLARPGDDGERNDRQPPFDPLEIEDPSLPRHPIAQSNRQRHEEAAEIDEIEEHTVEAVVAIDEREVKRPALAQEPGQHDLRFLGVMLHR